MEFDARVTTAAGVTFVAIRLQNPHPVAQRVRLVNRLDGPVLPPRTEGVPEAGWDEAGVTTVVPAEDTSTLGHACPAPPADPPVTLAEQERWDDSTGPDRLRLASRTLGVGHAGPAAGDASDPASGTGPEDRSGRTLPPALGDPTDPTALVRRLGRSAPPRDAVPPPDRGASEGDTGDGEGDGDVGDDGDTDGDGPGTGEDARPGDGETDEPDAGDGRPSVPPAVARWLAGIERRVRAADRLGLETSVAEATDVVAPLDGPPGDLPERLADDARALGRVAATCDRLADRADDAAVPTDSLRRLS
jgi:hypothetical protein